MAIDDEHRRAASCVGVALVLVGCKPWLNEEHCLFEGGDRGCGTGESCVVAIGDGEVPDADDGCLDSDHIERLDPERYLHLRYGLPRSLEAEGESEVLQSDSVQGILAREIDARGLAGICSDVVDLALPEGWPELEIVLALRRRFEGLRSKRKISDEEASIRPVEAKAVADVYARVEAWAEACEGELEGSTSGSEDGETTETADSGSTTTTGSTTEEPQCASNEDCVDSSAPFCDPEVGVCVSCEAMPVPDAACTEVNPTTPICLGGDCVACTANDPGVCEAQSLICDVSTSSCVPCTEHAQCGEAACDLFMGTCLPADAVVHVGPTQEFATITSAVASFPPGGNGTIIVHEFTYVESAVVDSGRRLALLAAEGERPSWDMSGAPQLTVVPGATAIVDGLTIAQNSSSVGVLVSGGHVWLDRAQLIDNDLGVQTTTGSELVMRSSFVSFTGSGYGGLALESSTAYISYSTVLAFDTVVPYAPLTCDSNSTLSLRNSIVLGDFGQDIDCRSAEVTHSATSSRIPGLSYSWFTDIYSGDLHLAPNGADVFAGIAQWQPGDPTTDIDGDDRPNAAGAPDYPGADVPSG